MDQYLSKFSKLEAKHYRLIILFQFLLIAGLLLNLALKPPQDFRTQAQSSSLNETVVSDVKACLALPQEDRAGCAELVGKKIAAQTEDPKEKLKACLAFRPHFYIYDCQQGLVEN